MAVTNRAKDPSEQKEVFYAYSAATATGVTGIAVVVPYACTLNNIQVAAFGLSGAPTVAIINNRFIAGLGATAMTVATGTSNTLAAFGTSGAQSLGSTFGLLIGASFVNLLANDVLMFQTGGSNSAMTGLAVAAVIQPIQDVKTYFGGIA